MLREEKVNHYIKRTLRHSHDVANLMFLITKYSNELSFHVDKYNLLNRAISHDTDKFQNDFVDAIVDLFDYKDEITEKRKKQAKAIIDEHYNSNTHHSKYHIDNDISLSNEDICEMACDWISSARKDNINLVENSEIWKDRFDNFFEVNSKEYLFFKNYREKFFEVFDLINKYIYNKNQ